MPTMTTPTPPKGYASIRTGLKTLLNGYTASGGLPDILRYLKADLTGQIANLRAGGTLWGRQAIAAPKPARKLPTMRAGTKAPAKRTKSTSTRAPIKTSTRAHKASVKARGVTNSKSIKGAAARRQVKASTTSRRVKPATKAAILAAPAIKNGAEASTPAIA